MSDQISVKFQGTGAHRIAVVRFPLPVPVGIAPEMEGIYVRFTDPETDGSETVADQNSRLIKRAHEILRALPAN